MFLWFTTNRFFVIKNPTKASELHHTRQICNLESIDTLPFGEICSESKKTLSLFSTLWIQHHKTWVFCFLRNQSESQDSISCYLEKICMDWKVVRTQYLFVHFWNFAAIYLDCMFFSTATVSPVFEAFLDEHAALWTIVGWPKKFGQEILRCLL